MVPLQDDFAPLLKALALGLALIFVRPGPVLSQEDAGVLDAVRIPPGDEAPVVDGLLSDPAWGLAVPVRGFRQREPEEGTPATDDTEVRVVFDGETLYVGILAHDREPDRIVSRILQRDRVLRAFGFGGFEPAGDDVVAILLDTFQDRRNAVVLATNPNGAEFDALLSNDGDEVNVDWRGVWEVASVRTPEGWSAEFAIPWRSLRFSAEPVQRWGINVTRFVQRTQEETMWRSWEREGGGFERVSRAGTLTGMANLPRAGMNLEAKPFVLGSRTQTRRGEGDYPVDGEVDVGIDLKSEIRPGLVLDLTYNTDFAQVEVDDQQVNLTRFSLFFPEKRDFFLENAGIFEFGQRGYFEPPPYLMFFSRRIGIGEDGEVPILGGGRLTGRIGRQTVGLLTVGTDAVPGREQELFNVVRVKRDVGASAYVGFMATDRRGSGDANTVAGADFQWYVDPTIQASGFVSRSTTEGPGGEGWAYQGSLNWTEDLWGGYLQFLNVDPGAVASSGFITRTDLRRVQGAIRRSVRPGILGIRKIDFRPSGQYQSTTDGRFQDWEVRPSLSFDFDSGADLRLNAGWGESQVDDDFTLAGLVDVPAGRYRSDQVSFEGGTSSARAWSLRGNARLGELYGGDLVSWGGTASVTPLPAFSFQASFNRNDVSLPGGDFVADIYSLRATWAFSTKIVTNALVQYNALTDDLLTNVRFNFIHRPGSDFYLVFTEDRGVDGELWELVDRGMVAKLTYLFRF
ncbi:MAG: hypothetical protein JSU98_14415 [Gemmatimonadales bacterium]|nr:MAG: hypothetical protein JSU98_14415 [Gemmatimonadales bacterium]